MEGTTASGAAPDALQVRQLGGPLQTWWTGMASTR